MTSIVSMIILVFLVKKNGLLKDRNGIKLFSIVILTGLVIPTLSRADNGTIIINFESKINLHDKLVVSLNIDGSESKETVAYGETLARPEDPTKEGYTFVGWFLEDGTEYDFDSQVSCDVMIKAKFTVNQYTLTASDVTAESTINGAYDYGTEITLTAVDKIGYTFKNWSNGETTKTIEFALTSDTIINPLYEANTYEVVFYSNGGTGSMSIQEFTYDEENTLNENGFTREGYEFKEWNTKADGSGDSYEDKASIKNLAESGTVNLYAIWKEKPILATANVTADNYGEYVDIGVDINADGNTTNDFRVFLNDGSNVYLIAADYIPNSMCPKSNQTTANNGTHSLNTNGLYKAYFTDNILGDYNGATDISGNSLLNSNYNKWANRTNLGNYASEYNAKAVAYMLDTTAWGVKFKNSYNSSYINYVTGGPTLEQFKESFNQIHTEEAEQIFYSESGIKGYYVNKGSAPTTQTYAKFSKADNNLYFITATTKADGAWLASPSAYEVGHVMRAYYSGYVNYYSYNNDNVAFRPLVSLKYGVSLVDMNEDGIYELQ